MNLEHNKTSKPRTRLSWWSAVLVLILSVITVPGIALTQRNVQKQDDRVVATDPSAMKQVTVWVTNKDGAPLGGASVEVLGDYRPVTSGVTNEEGFVDLFVGNDQPVQWIIALKDGEGFDYAGCNMESEGVIRKRPPTVLGKSLRDEVVLQLGGARTVRIRTTFSYEGATWFPGDKPDDDEIQAMIAEQVIEGVRLVPWCLTLPMHDRFVNLSGSGIAAVATDEGGDAYFRWFPRVLNDQIAPVFLVQGGEADGSGEVHYRDVSFDEELIDENSGDVIEIRAQLRTKILLEGMVRYADGRPAAGMTVHAQGAGMSTQFERAMAVTDESGRYSMMVAEGQMYTLAVIDEEWAGRADGVAVDGYADSVAVPNIILERGVLVTGRVYADDFTSEEFGATVPYAGEVVYLAYKSEEIRTAARLFGYRDDWGPDVVSAGLQIHTVTDQEGRFHFRIPEGMYFLAVMGGRVVGTKEEVIPGILGGGHGRTMSHEPWDFDTRDIPSAADGEERVLDIGVHIERVLDWADGGPVPWGPWTMMVKANRTGIMWEYYLRPTTDREKGAELCRPCHFPQYARRDTGGAGKGTLRYNCINKGDDIEFQYEFVEDDTPDAEQDDGGE